MQIIATSCRFTKFPVAIDFSGMSIISTLTAGIFQNNLCVRSCSYNFNIFLTLIVFRGFAHWSSRPRFHNMELKT